MLPQNQPGAVQGAGGPMNILPPVAQLQPSPVVNPDGTSMPQPFVPDPFAGVKNPLSASVAQHLGGGQGSGPAADPWAEFRSAPPNAPAPGPWNDWKSDPPVSNVASESPAPSVAADIAKSGGIGLVKGAIGLAGIGAGYTGACRSGQSKSVFRIPACRAKMRQK